MLLRREFFSLLRVWTREGGVADENSGIIDTPMLAKSKVTVKAELLGNVPMGRIGTADEAAELICWLLCDGSSYVTGTVQSIDGGWAC
jgi:NAD(P)-dependent dehydrogenase (short-subunit alcohol dehydrogenase family)